MAEGHRVVSAQQGALKKARSGTLDGACNLIGMRMTQFLVFLGTPY